MPKLPAFLSNDAPVLCCPYRGFFALTALSAVLFMTVWLLVLQGVITLAPQGGWTLWHGHELIYGLMGAATAGFVLTSISEFTNTATLPKTALKATLLLWLAARLAYLVSPYFSLYLALALNLVFWLVLVRYIAPPAWRQNGRRHISFALVLVLLAALELGFFVALLSGSNAQAWLVLGVHAFMALIIIAASRVSMSVLNGVVESGKHPERPTQETLYLARPPRRNFAIFSIGLFAASEFFYGNNALNGWLAFAAMAALLNLLNDWHIGKELFKRYGLFLYATYWLMALGYGLLGLSYLGLSVLPSSGHHLLTAGAMTLSTFTIMSIVSRIHSGRWLDRRAWLPLVALIFIGAALTRALAGVSGLDAAKFWLVAGLLWLTGFAIYARYFLPILLGPREDDQQGCAEPRAGH